MSSCFCNQGRARMFTTPTSYTGEGLGAGNLEGGTGNSALGGGKHRDWSVEAR